MIPVIDLFAGPGGLGEGFSSLKDCNGKPVFQTILSIEKDKQAHKTLRLRSYVRKLEMAYGKLPPVYLQYMMDPNAENLENLKGFDEALWAKAEKEALCAELVDGDDSLVQVGKSRLEKARRSSNEPWVLIGGPPCQAYSLVGRSRRTNDKEGLESDVKQTLYKCYLAFIRELKPTVFVMENVKGLLSATRKGEHVFDLICSDMNDAGYELRSLVTHDPTRPSDYVVKAENYGIPQKRHRVILLGIKKGCATPSDVLSPRDFATVKDAFGGIPPIRSGLSRRNEGWRDLSWKKCVDEAINDLLRTTEGKALADILLRVRNSHPQQQMKKTRVEGDSGRYSQWYRGRLQQHPLLANHEARSHMISDLARYEYCSAYAEKYQEPAKITDFPRYLYPNHHNVQNLSKDSTMEFADRFRVQLWDRPSTTVTSHIAKDGNYYIHPDPEQCRTLTVREAARLQTFPDDYFFEGNRTSQYTQVGNAVPPLLAQQIGKVVASFLGIESKGFCDSLPTVTGDVAP